MPCGRPCAPPRSLRESDAGAFVEGLDGSFENVMGFPVDDVERMLRAFTGEG